MIQEFLSQVFPPISGEELFDHLPDIVYFVKDAQGKYLIVNKTLAVRCCVRDKQALLGRTPAEVLKAPLGQQFAEQDQLVLSTGAPLLSQLELHVYASGTVGWCLTTKLPLRDAKDRVIGLMGVSQDLRLPNTDSSEYRQVASAIKFAEANLATPPGIRRLAEIARMSVYQLDRRMQYIFGLTTGQWLLKIRIDAAQRMLQESDLPIATIAHDAGYADQSAFSRHFRKATGLTPREFRQARRACL